MTMSLIETKTLGTAAASIEFTSIPQDGTDLVVLISARNSANTNIGTLAFNTGGSYTVQVLLGNGTGENSNTTRQDFNTNASSYTADTFASSQIYVPNYTGSTTKSYSVEAASENNASNVVMVIQAGLWSETAAITSLTLTAGSGGNLQIGSTASLYKVTKGSDGIVTTS
jgi:hypothetical protein